MEKKVITLEELKDFDVWKSWKNNEVELSTAGFVEMRIQQMIAIAARQEHEKYSKDFSDDEIQLWIHGFIRGANYIIENKLKNI
jgi:hypothetical protein